MKIRIKLFAAARELSEGGDLELEVANGIVVRDMKIQISGNHPGLSELILRSAVSINREFATDESVIHENDEIALIPPVSGG